MDVIHKYLSLKVMDVGLRAELVKDENESELACNCEEMVHDVV